VRDINTVSLLQPIKHGDLVRLSNGEIVECHQTGTGGWHARYRFESQRALIDWLVARDDELKGPGGVASTDPAITTSTR